MNTEIINRVAKSNLITIDLSDYYPKGKRAVIDIKNWLKEGLVLIEKDFRQSLNNYNWNQFKGHHIAIFCSTDAIIPIWAYMLVQKNLNGIAKSITYGSTETMESVSIPLKFCHEPLNWYCKILLFLSLLFNCPVVDDISRPSRSLTVLAKLW